MPVGPELDAPKIIGRVASKPGDLMNGLTKRSALSSPNDLLTDPAVGCGSPVSGFMRIMVATARHVVTPLVKCDRVRFPHWRAVEYVVPVWLIVI